jgi:hypothetical protein
MWNWYEYAHRHRGQEVIIDMNTHNSQQLKIFVKKIDIYTNIVVSYTTRYEYEYSSFVCRTLYNL